ncbi:MAG: site-specific integrase [Candidatus Melainabacteria bacterium]|nr:site-specific integrase [Candidatus Melainabacteria bacterium]
MSGQAKVLTSQEISDIFKLLKSPRDRALFALGIYTGMRIGEIIRLRTEQLYTTNGGIRNVLKVERLKKKNTVYNEIPVHPKLREKLTAYQKTASQSEWLFPSEDSQSGHLCRDRAHDILRNVFDRLQLQDASTHSMRRTCLTNMSRSGVPLRTIQEISGHSHLGQLQDYLAVDPADKHRAINLLKY